MNKIYLILLTAFIPVFFGCESVTDDSNNEKKSFIKISITDTALVHEAVSWIDFELRDETKSITAVDAYYLGSRIGLGAFEETLDEFTKKGKIQVNTFPLPESAMLSIVAKNDNLKVDSITLKISVLKREQKEFYSLFYEGDIYTDIYEGIKLPDGRVFAVAHSGYMVFNTDLSFTVTPYSGLIDVVLTDAGEVCLIDSQARIFRWNGSSLERIGQIEIPYAEGYFYNFGDVIYVNGNFYTITIYDNARILMYNPELDSTTIFDLTPHLRFNGVAISKGPGTTVLAAFNSGSSLKLFKLTGNQYTEIQLPEVEYFSDLISIYTDTQDFTWLSLNRDLYRLNGDNFEKIDLPNTTGFYCSGTGGDIRKMYRDEQGNLWIAKLGGILRYSGKIFNYYPGSILAERYTYCGADGSDADLVFPGINGGVFCISRGIDIGNVLTHLSNQSNQ